MSKQKNLEESVVGEKVLQVSGWYNQQVSSVNHFFSLPSENKKLVDANAELQREIVRLKDQEKETGMVLKTDSTEEKIYKFSFLPVKIINNSIFKTNNYITINKGEIDGVKKGMGVVTDLGVIGRVERTSNNYSIVQSLLSQRVNVNAQIKGDPNNGTLIWEGKDYTHVTLTEFSKFTKVEKGDTIETYGGRSIFPRHHPIGVVDSTSENKVSGNLDIHVKLYEDFGRLLNAYVVINIDFEEIQQLEEETLTENEENNAE